MQRLRAIYRLLSPRERMQLSLIFMFMVPNALMQVAGIASIMPFIAVMSQPELIESNAVIARFHQAVGSPPIEGFLVILALLALALLVLGNALAAFTTWLITRFSHMRIHTLSRKLLATYLGQGYDFFLGRNPSDLTKNVTQEVGSVVSGYLIPLLQLAANAIVVIAILTMLILVDPVLAVTVGLLLGGAYGAVYWGFRRRIRLLGQRRLAANTKRFKSVHEAFGAVKDLKVSGRESHYVNAFSDASYRFARAQSANVMIAELPRYALETLAFGLVLAIALYLVTAGGSMQSALPIIALYAMAGYRLMPALQKLFVMMSNMRFADPVVERINEELALSKNRARSPSDRPRALTEENAEAQIHLDRELQLNDISYRYPGTQQPSLYSISLAIRARSTVAFVGGSGAGKSTLVDIILALLEPESGCVLVDGKRLTPEMIPAWQRRLGYVPQSIYLADDTVRNNIALGVPDREIDEEAVLAAAQAAAIHEFIIRELPDGYGTMTGDRGVRLSGGQRQRIGIARALYHNPEVLILDEATSALDGSTEAAVMDAIDRLGGAKTIIMIAHRLSTVRGCDQLHLLDKGRLVDSGTYDELMARQPLFQQMARGGRAQVVGVESA